ncbi:MAG: DUF2130 domain-containing protein [Actinomycetota bacterium]|nr:DUF2130 domain-containing protein [Actinomycetota bacterium]
MEAATPLRPARVTVLANRVVVDGLVVDDETVVGLLRAREEAGDDPVKVVEDALEIGARVLDREHVGANAEFVKAEFERAARALDAEFVERARRVAERLDQKVDEVFSPDHGHVTRTLHRHFGDESSVAVQNRVKALLAEASVAMREDLRKQFSSDSEHNPLAGFQRASLAVMKQSSDQQAERLGEMTETITALRLEVERLRGERAAAEEVAAEAERGTAKGRTFEEAVHEALDRIAVVQGDDCDAVGDTKGTTRKTGDIVVALEGCRGPARGRVVFEAKTAKLSKRVAIEELDRAREERGADYAVLVVPNEEKVPARLQTLREYNGDKLVVCFDPEDGSTLALEVAYSLARARVLMARGESDGVDAAAVREAVERAMGSMGEVQKVKQQLTGATTSIENARKIVDAMATQVRAQLAHIESLLEAAEPEEDGGPAPVGASAPAAVDLRLEV